MSARRTELLELDDEWSYGAAITKADVDATTGKRYIQGVASGVLEDADGERVSRNALVKMARQALDGLKLTSSHAQDWSTEIGDLVTVKHDAKTDELLVKAELPAEGIDPIADKAWNALTKQGKKLGFSIGGKLKGAFYEQTETGKRRKVLDEIGLRHVMLTEVPAYRRSFAHAVAKSLSAPPVDADAYVDDVADEDDLPVDLVLNAPEAEKTAPTPGEVEKAAPDDDGDDDGAAPAPSADAAAGTDGGQPAAAAQTEAKPDATPGEMSDAEAAQALPVAQHFACPSCGAEFAQPLEADEQPERPTPTPDTDDTAKTASPKETTMDPKTQETLDRIRGLADAGEAVAKTAAEEAPAKAAEAAEAVTKTELSVEDLAGVVAKSHTANESALAELADRVGEGFEAVAKAFAGLKGLVEDLPAGRKSTARVLPTRDEVEKTEGGTDDVAKAIDEASGTVEALKALNRSRGIQ